MPRRKHKRFESQSSRDFSNEQSGNSSLEEDLRQQRQRQQQRLAKQQREQEKRSKISQGDNSGEDIDEIDERDLHPSHSLVIQPHHHLVVKGSSLPWPRYPQHHQQPLQHDNIHVGNSYTSTPSSFALLYSITQQSPTLSLHQRQRLSHWQYSRFLLENMLVNTKASTFYQGGQKLKWQDHMLPDGTYCAYDMACKQQLQPSARTLDVGMMIPHVTHNGRGSNNHHDSTTSVDSASNFLPTIVSTVHSGFMLYQPPNRSGRFSVTLEDSEMHLAQSQRIRTLRCQPVHSIRIHENSQRVGAVVRNTKHSARDPYQFHWYPLPHATNYIEADLPTPVNDFCFGTDLAIFACPRVSSGHYRNNNRYDSSSISDLLVPLFLPLDHPSHTSLRSLNVNNFPQSDALRVEMSCTKRQQQQQHEKYLAFGHRNGQVSLLDLRQSHTCVAILSSGYSTHARKSTVSFGDANKIELGSATDLGFLTLQQQLLVKRAFGACQLHDLRKLSTSSATPSLVHTLTVPQQSGTWSDPSTLLESSSSTHPSDTWNSNSSPVTLHKTLSANCNGFCVDPLSERTLVSPFMNTNHEPCLGVWSLTTGDLVGIKRLHTNPNKETFHVELCSHTTPATTISSPTFWKYNKNNSSGSFFDSNSHGGGEVSKDAQAFGVWLKCGRISKNKLNGKTTSLHHVTLPGRWSSPC